MEFHGLFTLDDSDSDASTTSPSKQSPLKRHQLTTNHIQLETKSGWYDSISLKNDFNKFPKLINTLETYSIVNLYSAKKYQQALDLALISPPTMELKLLIINCHLHLNQPSEALIYYNTHISKSNEPFLLYLYSKINFLLGNYTAAAHSIISYLEMRTDDYKAWKQIFEIFFAFSLSDKISQDQEQRIKLWALHAGIYSQHLLHRTPQPTSAFSQLNGIKEKEFQDKVMNLKNILLLHDTKYKMLPIPDELGLKDLEIDAKSTEFLKLKLIKAIQT